MMIVMIMIVTPSHVNDHDDDNHDNDLMMHW